MYWKKLHPHPIKYFWQCAYIDAKADNWVLPDYVYAKLSNYDKLDRSYGRKYYHSYDRAMKDYRRVMKNPSNILCDNCWKNTADQTYLDSRDDDFIGYTCNEYYQSKFRSLLDILLQNKEL